MPVIALNKPEGMTPLQAMDRFRKQQSEYADAPMTYAGRLDPMAEGVLLVLAGDARFHKDRFLNLDKGYTATFCIGIGTDTYDALGLVTHVAATPPPIERIKTALSGFEGPNVLPYPPYSSYKIDGKPLFVWAREGRLEEIEVPTREMVIRRLRVTETRHMAAETLLGRLPGRINAVDGDFRQDEIVTRWQDILGDASTTFPCVTVRIQCETGTYIRAIAHALGRRLGSAAFLWRLTRDRVGSYRSSDATHVLQ